MTDRNPADNGTDVRRQRRLLAVRRGALGDFVLTLPALRALRESRPGVEIHLLTLPAYGRLAAHFGFADSWRSLESASAAALFQDGGALLDPGWREWLEGFEEIVSWLPDRDGQFQKRLLATASRPESTVFYQAPWLCDGTSPAARQFGNVADIRQACSGHALLKPENSPSGGAPATGSNSAMIALHPGSGSPRKNWPFPRWAGTLSTLAKKHRSLKWLLVTGEAEEDRLPAMASALDAAGLAWESAHGLELIPLTERLHQCAALLGHDSGVSHLASACGVPCFLLFGPTDPKVWAPATPEVRVLETGGKDLSDLTAEKVLSWLTVEAAGLFRRL